MEKGTPGVCHVVCESEVNASVYELNAHESFTVDEMEKKREKRKEKRERKGERGSKKK